jgi:hypothetical protein
MLIIIIIIVIIIVMVLYNIILNSTNDLKITILFYFITKPIIINRLDINHTLYYN